MTLIQCTIQELIAWLYPDLFLQFGTVFSSQNREINSDSPCDPEVEDCPSVAENVFAVGKTVVSLKCESHIEETSENS